MLSDIYTAVLYQPLYNILVYVYNIIPGNDIGIAIIVLTILIKIILLPFSKQSIRSQKALQDIQPKVEEMRKKYKDDKEKQAQELMKLYKQEKVNPFSSCLPLLIQLPFFIAVYHVFRNGLTSPESLDLVYSFIMRPESINPVSFGFFNLAERNIVMAVLAGIAQWFQAKMLTHKKQPAVPGSSDENAMASMNKQMMYMMPVITVIIGTTLPSGLMLYWLITSLLTIVQQKLIFSKMTPEKKGDVEVLPAPEDNDKK